MSNIIEFEDMPNAAKEAYNKTNSARKLGLFVSWAACIICTVIVVYKLIEIVVSSGMTTSELFQDSDDYSALWVSVELILAIVLSVGGIIMGVVHINLYTKKLLKAGIFGLAIWFFLTLFIGGCIGPFLFVFDTVRFIMKKPLVLKLEHNCFMKTDAVKQELMMTAMAGLQSDNESSSAMENLQKLKEMLDSGIITEDEFNLKKAEMLERI